MQLRELADVRAGLKVPHHILLKEKKRDGTYFQFLLSTDFVEGLSHFIYQKELRKIPDFSSKSFLFYGDYIVYKNNNDFKLYRYESISGQTIAGNGLIILRPDIGILKDFLGYEKNKKYFLHEIKRIEKEDGEITIQSLEKIEIGTDNILELENANKAEQIGIRKAIDISDLPIRLTQKPLPADKLLKRIDNKELLLDTEFQRRPGLWDISTKSRLIESMIVRLPIPAFYFDGSNDDEWLVIDGLQRLSAIHDFVNDKFTLIDLDYLPDLQDKSFNQLERRHQRNIEEYEVFAYIIEKGTPKSVTYKIFKNINTSALKLEPQEIRHAINPGAPAELLKKIAAKNWFRKGLMLTDRQRDRMEDRETALRFIAFKRSRYTEYRPGIIDFLDAAMTDIYDIPISNQDVYITELESVFNVAYETLGEKAFSRSLFDSSRAYGHNNILFEMLTYGISIMPKDKRNRLKETRLDFKNVIVKHFSNKPDRFWDTDNAYTIENLRKRFEEIEVIFKKLVQ